MRVDAAHRQSPLLHKGLHQRIEALLVARQHDAVGAGISGQVLTEIERDAEVDPGRLRDVYPDICKAIAKRLGLHREFRRELALPGTENEHDACICRNGREILDVFVVDEEDRVGRLSIAP